MLLTSPSYREWWGQNKDRILSEIKNDMSLTIEDLKTIRLALSSYPLSTGLIETMGKIDDELAKHNLKAVYKSKPKRPYQRQADGEYVFEPINNYY